MNILYLYGSADRNATDLYAMNLIRFLTKLAQKHVVLHSPAIHIDSSWKNIKWDIVFIHNWQLFEQHRIYLRQLPLILITDYRLSASKALGYPEIRSIIFSGSGVHPTHWGFPDECIVDIDMPLLRFNSNVAEDAARPLVHIPDEEDTQLHGSRLAIRAMNSFPRLACTVMAGKEATKVLKTLANDHIRFKKIPSTATWKLPGNTILIGSKKFRYVGEQADFIDLTPWLSQLAKFCRSSYHNLSAPELLPTQRQLEHQITRVLTGNRTNPAAIPACRESQLLKAINEAIAINAALNSPNLKRKLYPVIVKHVFFKNYNGEDVAIVDNRTGKFAGSITQDELQVITQCTGRLNLEEIIQTSSTIKTVNPAHFIDQLIRFRIAFYSIDPV